MVQSNQFKKLRMYEQNILKWAALLHDIAKRGPPEFEGKDHVHPFNSALATLVMFKDMELLTLRNQDEQQNFQIVIKKLEDSHKPI